ncbi:MAG: glutathione S-transferase family protein [Sulfurifustis sp.]
MKLYMHPFSTFSRRVRIALVEKNIPVEMIALDMAARKHKAPEYLALNPYARVPTLVDGDFVLYESTPILNYLEALHPEPALVPRDAKARALVDMHMKLCDLQFAPHTATIIFPKRFLPKERWDENAIARAKVEIEKHLPKLEQALKGHEYLVGDRFTLADICYLPFVEFFGLMEITPPPAIAEWTKRLLDRPSARETKPAA